MLNDKLSVFNFSARTACSLSKEPFEGSDSDPEYNHESESSDSTESEQDKLLNKLEENEPEQASCQEEECVICIHAKATMQTAPCGHQVVCRKCFVKTIQIAVSQRLLPLRCVICRSKILRLKTGPILPTSASGYSVNSRSSSVPQSDSLYSVSSGFSGSSSISSTSCSSAGSGQDGQGGNHHGAACCGAKGSHGHCLGAYPRQPTGALRRSQQHAMKVKLQEYCHRSADRPPYGGHVPRLPPIKEMTPLSGVSPAHSVAPASTRIRCAQKIVTQLESGRLSGSSKRSRNHKYEKLPQNEDEIIESKPEVEEKEKKEKKWWGDRRWRERNKSEERNDNKKNEVAEKHMEMMEKQKLLQKEDKDAKEDKKKGKKDNGIKEKKL